jgi:signal transduction histidine kinase
MGKLMDKAVILILSLILYALEADSMYMVVPVLVALILSAALSYFENDKITLPVYFFYLMLCLFYIELVPLTALFSYDSSFMKTKGYYWAFSFFPLAVHYKVLPLFTVLFTAAFILIAVLLKKRTADLEGMEKAYHELRDNAAEISLKLEKQNKELIDRQDYEVHLATITERNRIAREIHDNVGHLLTRSILQVGALLAINKDKSITEPLKAIKDTLSEAMDSIRASVHNLHEHSIDLKNEIDKLIKGFEFCPVIFHYDIEDEPDKNIKYCFIAVVKEALSNIMKHSNATEASISMIKHPALYQLIIKDNGTKGSYRKDEGIGIQNITDRITALEGNIHISSDKGFRIFISIPRKKSKG